MPITRCPGCDEEFFEVPPTVPGGLVACPYCGTEFAASGRGGARRKPSRGRRDYGYDDYDEGPARRGYRKKSDPLPFIIGIAAVVILGGVAVVVMMKAGEKKEARSQAELARLAAIPSMSIPMPAPSPPPDTGRPPFELPTLYKEGDLVTLMDLSYTSGINYPENDPQVSRPFGGLSYTLKTVEHGEKITGVEGDKATHEGHYLVSSYIRGDNALANFEIDAAFQTDRLGLVVPGSFRQTGGPPLSPVPEFFGDRGFGILPQTPKRLYELWGLDTLPNPLARGIILDGQTLDSLPMQRQRGGGWKVATGTLESREDGSWTHKAVIELHLHAVENGIIRNTTYHGQPAEISCATRWKGEAEYKLQKQVLARVGNFTVDCRVRVKTAKGVYDWVGLATTNFSMYKDP